MENTTLEGALNEYLLNENSSTAPEKGFSPYKASNPKKPASKRQRPRIKPPQIPRSEICKENDVINVTKTNANPFEIIGNSEKYVKHYDAFKPLSSINTYFPSSSSISPTASNYSSLLCNYNAPVTVKPALIKPAIPKKDTKSLTNPFENIGGGSEIINAFNMLPKHITITQVRQSSPLSLETNTRNNPFDILGGDSTSKISNAVNMLPNHIKFTQVPQSSPLSIETNTSTNPFAIVEGDSTSKITNAFTMVQNDIAINEAPQTPSLLKKDVLHNDFQIHRHSTIVPDSPRERQAQQSVHQNDCSFPASKKRKIDSETSIETINNLSSMVDGGVGLNHVQENVSNNEIITEIRLNRKRIIMIYRLLIEQKESGVNSDEKGPFTFPVSSLEDLDELERLLKGGDFEENLLLHLTEKLRLKNEDAEGRIDKSLQYMFEDEIFEHVGWSKIHNAKKKRKDGRIMKSFNSFLQRLTNIAKMKPMKDAVSRYADLARRRLSRKLKADEVHLIED